MAPEEREEMILKGAIHFFSKHGFGAQIRELSRELNVSQALIFRYFGSKNELIERVYERSFISRWSDEWTSILCDRNKPLRDRLVQFYIGYLDNIDHFEWIRIAMFSGLAGNQLTKRYIETQVERLLDIIAVETHQAARENGNTALLTRDEAHEQVWTLHSTFIYFLIRKHVFKTRVLSDQSRFTEIAVDTYLHGITQPRAE
ncbi:TetR/AcrR family transcriptional regulator [Roseovarius sp.]|uniref:TetR/AcrR family transcriptional regulator n=1 Tax=Roseovarius sp. TaxID=1486281 RepID=UPI003569190D